MGTGSSKLSGRSGGERYAEGTKNQIRSDFMEEAEKRIREHSRKLWGDEYQDGLIPYDIEDARRWIDDAFWTFDRAGLKNIIEPAADDPDYSMVWKFSGHEKDTGKFVQFDFMSGYTEQSARDTLRSNGYSIYKGLLFPKPVFNYVVDNTNMTDTDIRNAKILASVALKRKRDQRKKENGKK